MRIKGFFRIIGVHIIVSFLIVCPIAFGNPIPPTKIEAIPIYSNNGTYLKVSWQDTSISIASFNVYRREFQNPPMPANVFSLLAVVPGIDRVFSDYSASIYKYWEYQICAVDMQGQIGSSAISYRTSSKQNWPIENGTHDILHNFGVPLNFISTDKNGMPCWVQYFHNGVDISARAMTVVSARGGRVVQVDPPAFAGGQIWMEVDYGTGPELECYAHVAVFNSNICQNLKPGGIIAPGDVIGVVRDNYFNRAPEADHLHWDHGQGDLSENNLPQYTSTADRDPFQMVPIVSSISHPGQPTNEQRDFDVVDAHAGTTIPGGYLVIPATVKMPNDHTKQRNPAFGDVDFIIDAYDQMFPNAGLMVNPYRIGYWIQPPVFGNSVGSHDKPYQFIAGTKGSGLEMSVWFG